MIVKAIPLIPHELINIEKLLVAVLTVLSPVIGKFILHIERLRHVEAIQPYLVRIDLFVPEVTCGGAGLSL